MGLGFGWVKRFRGRDLGLGLGLEVRLRVWFRVFVGLVEGVLG